MSPSLWDRMRERRADRRQKRAWRKERRKPSVNAYDAHNQAESGLYKKGGFFTKK
jgi:hypothetical protein